MQLLGTKVCKKYDLGVHNNLFGGTMLSWIDESAVAFVNEVCHCPTMVTLKIEEVLFKSPVKENNLIKIYGQIDRIGGKSITVSVEAHKNEACAAHHHLFVAVDVEFPSLDDDGKSIPIANHVREKHPDKCA